LEDLRISVSKKKDKERKKKKGKAHFEIRGGFFKNKKIKN